MVNTAVLPTMRSQKSGAIVNISSGAGRFGFPSGSAYVSTKFAVEGLSESIPYGLEPFGIKVVIVEPGVIRTTYGESIAKPIIIDAITIGLSTLFWIMQSKPTLKPHFVVNSSNGFYNLVSQSYLNQAGNSTHWFAAFQRSLADFLTLLSLPNEIKVGVIDYIIKIVGGALTFGLIIIALRKFEIYTLIILNNNKISKLID